MCAFIGSLSLLSWTSPWQRLNLSSWPGHCRRSSISSFLKRTKKQSPETNRNSWIRTQSSHGSVWHIYQFNPLSLRLCLWFYVIKWSVFFQLEESNKTLTKDVEILSKEKSELSERLRNQEGGNFFSQWFMDYLHNLIHFLIGFLCSVWFPAFAADKEEVANSVKANYEKALNIERTLKTQVWP